MRHLAASYALVIGVIMLGMWATAFATDQVPELQSRPVELGFHVLAEAITAVSLIVSGVALWIRRPWAYRFYLLASGMLLYTLIMSPGYFLQEDHPEMIALFGALLGVSLFLAYQMIRSRKRFR